MLLQSIEILRAELMLRRFDPLGGTDTGSRFENSILVTTTTGFGTQISVRSRRREKVDQAKPDQVYEVHLDSHKATINQKILT